MTTARRFHLLTAAVAVTGLVLQVVSAWVGYEVTDDSEPAGRGLRLVRLVAYFTIQSNALVAFTTLRLVARPDDDTPLGRALRLVSTVAITVTGVVHYFLLRPLVDLEGLELVADTFVHVAVPVLALAGWLLLGPRPRAGTREGAATLAYPLAWLAVTLAVGAVSGWYPYPFLDPAEDGAGAVAASCVGITVLFVLLIGTALLADRRLPPAPRHEADSAA